MAIKQKTQRELLNSINISLKNINDFLQGEFFEKIESLDWKVWELHNKSERNDKILETMDDIKSLLRVHLMNDNLQPEANEEVEGKPESVIGKLFKSKK
tara:strand:- start:576 stop:872 length:297 start_codon:yes stop_codon:yes gene_type:complete